MSWFKRGPSVSERLAALEARLDEQQAVTKSLLETATVVVRTMNEIIDSHAAATVENLGISIALTRRLFDAERDLSLVLETATAVGIDVTQVKSVQAEIIKALRGRERASSDSMDLPLLGRTEPESGPN